VTLVRFVLFSSAVLDAFEAACRSIRRDSAT
jgi:hypothetical protein